MGALRNFCRNASPFRCRNGLLVLPKEVARSDIVRSRQITLMALPCLERTHAVVLRVSCDRPRAAVGKLRRVPGADATNANAAPMRLVLHHLLDILGPPVMQPLPLGAPFSTRKIAVLHDDDVNLEFIRKLHDEVCRLDGNVHIDNVQPLCKSNAVVVMLEFREFRIPVPQHDLDEKVHCLAIHLDRIIEDAAEVAQAHGIGGRNLHRNLQSG